MEAVLYQDIPRLYTAFAEWLACLLYIRLIRGRLLEKNIILTSGASLFAMSLFLYVTADLPIFMWLPCMIAAIVMMYVFMYATCDA